jgi:hypothetical protein
MLPPELVVAHRDLPSFLFYLHPTAACVLYVSQIVNYIPLSGAVRKYAWKNIREVRCSSARNNNLINHAIEI